MSGPYNVTFPAGMTATELDVPINNDNICEPSETFIVTISTSSLPNRVTNGDPGQAAVTVIDNSELLYSYKSKEKLVVLYSQ